MEDSDRPGNDRPMKRAKVENRHDDDNDGHHAPGAELDAVALSFQATLVFGTCGTSSGEDSATQVRQQSEPSEPSPLLLKVMAYLATSIDLVQTRAVCLAFLSCSDEIADAKTRKLIGDSVRPMVGQNIVGLLHGAEDANEATRARLREWDAEAGRTAGISVGLPTLAIPPTEDSSGHLIQWDIIALVDSFDSDVPGCRVPIKVQVMERARTARVGLPEGFFHPRVMDNGVVDRTILFRTPPQLLACINITMSFLNTEKQYRNRWSSAQRRTMDCMAYDISAFCDETIYNRFFTKCLNIFVDYRLGEPIPSRLEPFREECVEMIRELRTIAAGFRI